MHLLSGLLPYRAPDLTFLDAHHFRLADLDQLRPYCGGFRGEIQQGSLLSNLPNMGLGILRSQARSGSVCCGKIGVPGTWKVAPFIKGSRGDGSPRPKALPPMIISIQLNLVPKLAF